MLARPSGPGQASISAAALVEKIQGKRARFVAFVRGRMRPDADAEEIFQQALVKAYEKASSLREPSRWQAWFYRILRRTLADHHAKSAVAQSRTAELSEELSDASAEEVTACCCTLGLLDQLKPQYANLLRRIDLEDATIREVADELGVSQNNLTVRVHRARKALRAKLVEFCGATSAKDYTNCDCA